MRAGGADHPETDRGNAHGKGNVAVGRAGTLQTLDLEDLPKRGKITLPRAKELIITEDCSQCEIVQTALD